MDNSDMDDDGIADKLDNCIKLPNPLQEDYDSDNIGNVCDSDDDNDGIVDKLDAFDLDPTEWKDFDFDFIGSNADTDDDNDGILDTVDSSPTIPSEELFDANFDLILLCAEMDSGYSKQSCYGDFFSSLINDGTNSDDALMLGDYLSQLDATYDCHFIAHEIGTAAFKKNPYVIENFTLANDACRDGYRHAIIASYFDSIKTSGEQVLESHKSVCDDFINSSNEESCLHGLGHGFVMYYNNNLEKALDECDQTYKRGSCVNGAMMEYTKSTLISSSSFQNDIPNICSRTDLRYDDFKTCNKQLGKSLTYFTNHEYDDTLQLCNYILDKEAAEFCKEGVKSELDTVTGMKPALTR